MVSGEERAQTTAVQSGNTVSVLGSVGNSKSIDVLFIQFLFFVLNLILLY